MPISWTIQKNAEAAVTFGSLNLHSAQLQVVTQAPDLFTVTQAADYDADPVFAHGDTVTIYREAAQWFKGRCIATPRQGSGSAERISYKIAGPWWQLANIIYEQDYTREYKGETQIQEETVNLARIILGTDLNGNRVHSGQVITAAVNYALTQIGAGALFQLGTVEVATAIPFEEVKTVSCAEIITRVLRWNPDVVAYFDYATLTPTLHFKRRASLAALTYDIEDVVITDNNINPRHDLQKDGVEVKYERTDTFDGRELTEILTDSAGDLGDPFKVLKVYINLEGSQVSLTKQTVEVETIQETSGAWWRRQLPQLAGATSVTVSGGTRTPVDDEDDGGQNDGSSFDSMLVSGSIADWMTRKVCDQVIKGEVTYTKDGVTKTEDLTFSVRGTNAVSKTYTYVSNSSAGESPPTGLASAVLSSFSRLHYEGSITLHEAEVGATDHIKKRLNVLGGRSEWESMHAQIYNVRYSLDSGTTQIDFGPAKHLGADDLFQLTRNVRTRQGANGSIRRGGSSSQSVLPTKGPATITAGGGSSSSGVMVIYLAGQTVPNLIYLSSIMEGYDPETDDNWFIQFQVENGRLKDLFTDAPTGTSNTTPFDGDAEASTDQTYFRLPLIYSTEGEKITNDLSGIYRENVVCTATGPKAELIRIG